MQRKVRGRFCRIEPALRAPVPRQQSAAYMPSYWTRRAASEPARPVVYAPRSPRPEDGWQAISYGQLANAVNLVAAAVARQVKAGSQEPFPTLAYVGPNDVRYLVVMLACVKAACQALFLSPRNSVDSQLNLLERMRCRHVWYTASSWPLVESWIRRRPVQTAEVPPPEAWLDATAEAFPYNRCFDDARWDPCVVLHTSGSTGLPKPIVVRQGSLAIGDGFQNAPQYQGSDLMWTYLAAHSDRMFMPMPLFHAAGLCSGLILQDLYCGKPVCLGMPNQPLTAELVVKCLKHSGADSALLPPSTIEELARTEEGLSALKKLNFVAFGGGSLAKATGDRLVEWGANLVNTISSTELFPYAIHRQERAELWQYFVINSEAMGADWRRVAGHDDVYELWVRRKDARDPGTQPLFYNFPDLTEWSTGDLYKAHPSLPEHWTHYGRSDDVVVFSTGEKLNPVTIESVVAGHSSLSGALVVGKDRFQPALILEPLVQPQSEAEAQALIDAVWPLVEKANAASVAHGRIERRLVSLSDPRIPFQRAPKGTMMRSATVRAYQEFVDALYERADEAGIDEAVPLDLGNEEALTRAIAALACTHSGARELRPESDFFSVGIDSQQVASIAKVLRVSVKSAGVALARDTLNPRDIYTNPTPGALACYLVATLGKGDGQGRRADVEARERDLVRSLVAKYTRHLPTPAPGKPDPWDEGQTVVVTGTTGSLGAYLLDRLCSAPQVAKVVALNRGDDGGRSRQEASSRLRGLASDFHKVDFVRADLAQPYLGLERAQYDELVASADRIIHNAWPVNFKMSVASFEPWLRGLRGLVDLSSRAAKHMPIIFTSSISTVAGWTRAEAVPEVGIDDLGVAHMGYGLSKLAGSLILDAAAAQSGIAAASVRVGQVAGPRGGGGIWNKHEYLPSLIASSAHLGMLPAHLGSGEEVDWMPVEDVAGILLDLAGVTTRQPLAAICGYFHAVNPAKTTWSALAPAVMRSYAGRIKTLVRFEDWLTALRSSVAGDKNPAVKLVDTYRGMLQQPMHVNFAMERTARHSPTAAGLSPIMPGLMTDWCGQWKKHQDVGVADPLAPRAVSCPSPDAHLAAGVESGGS